MDQQNSTDIPSARFANLFLLLSIREVAYAPTELLYFGVHHLAVSPLLRPLFPHLTGFPLGITAGHRARS